MSTTNQPINVKLLDGSAINVRFPSDQEWVERQRRRKIIVRDLGRGNTETNSSDPDQSEAALVSAICLDDESKKIAAGMSPAGAQIVLNALANAEVRSCARTATGYEVSGSSMQGAFALQCRMPDAEAILRYRRTYTRAIDGPFNVRTIVVNLDAARELFDSICDAKPSIVVKAQAVTAILTDIDQLNAPQMPDQFQSF